MSNYTIQSITLQYTTYTPHTKLQLHSQLPIQTHFHLHLHPAITNVYISSKITHCHNHFHTSTCLHTNHTTEPTCLPSSNISAHKNQNYHHEQQQTTYRVHHLKPLDPPTEIQTSLPLTCRHNLNPPTKHHSQIAIPFTESPPNPTLRLTQLHTAPNQNPNRKTTKIAPKSATSASIIDFATRQLQSREPISTRNPIQNSIQA